MLHHPLPVTPNAKSCSDLSTRWSVTESPWPVDSLLLLNLYNIYWNVIKLHDNVSIRVP